MNSSTHRRKRCSDTGATDRRRADERFRALLESAPDAMVIVNETGEIVLVNAQAERLFGYKRDELLGRSVEMVVPERARGAHVAHLMKFFTTAHPRPMGAGWICTGDAKNGSEFPVEISLSPLSTGEGTLVASAIRDLTERRQAEEERTRLLRERAARAEASRIKDEFLATLSHELRTPLNAILGWIRSCASRRSKDPSRNGRSPPSNATPTCDGGGPRRGGHPSRRAGPAPRR